MIGTARSAPAASGSTVTAGVPAGAFAENGSYRWRLRGGDGTAWSAWSAYCEFTIDTTKPSAAPSVTSTDYPQGQWSGSANKAGSFTFSAGGVPDVTSYEYGLDVNPPNQSVNATSRIVATAYDWERRLPITVTEDPGGLNLVTRTSYNADSQATAHSRPASKGATNTPHTLETGRYGRAALRPWDRAFPVGGPGLRRQQQLL